MIATPIGNLGDLSQRAVQALQSCDLLLCEDTRVTRKLLSHVGISVPVRSHHEHNEQAQIEDVLARLEEGQRIGLVSDAGTPLLSDPGFPIVRAARARGVAVEPVPGPSAGVAALSVSGIAPVPYCFVGFVPRQRGERRALFRSLRNHGMTTVAFESPNRLLACLEDLEAELGSIEVTVARELTKMHEEVVTGSAKDLRSRFEERERVRGEITLVIGPAAAPTGAVPEADALRAEFEALRTAGMRRTDAVKALAERYGLQRRELYDLLAEV